MICYNLNKDFKQCGAKHLGRWVQRIVFVNKSQVNEVFRDGNLISFTLKTGERGISFEYSETFNQILGNYEVVEKFNYKQFRHNVQASLSGLDYDTMGLNNGEYFVALMDSKSRVYIFGFDYLLKPEDYLYETHQMNTITLRSSDVGLEDNIPLTYISNKIKDDFMNNFESAKFALISPNGTKYIITADEVGRLVTNETSLDAKPYYVVKSDITGYQLRVNNDGIIVTNSTTEATENIEITYNNITYKVTASNDGRVITTQI